MGPPQGEEALSAPYILLYHPMVAEQNLQSIPLNVQRRIARAIEARLSSSPEQYGEPLKGTLKGYWKLRVGDYRIVYKITGIEIRVLGIRHRRKIYEDIRRRIGLPPPR